MPERAGNLAHALKTPLSVLANAANAPEKRMTTWHAWSHLKSIPCASRLITNLSRAQAAASVQVPGMRTAVEPVIRGLVRVMERVRADRHLEFVVLPDPANPAFRGEEQDLQEMLGNLIDNASKWARSRIEIRVSDGAGRPGEHR